MPITNCQGFSMKFTRDISRKEYIEMVESIEKRLNKDHGGKYTVVLEKKWEGGFLLSKGEEKFKTMRHTLRMKSDVGRLLDPYPWPWIYEDTMMKWKLDDKNLISKGTFASTLLRSSPIDTVWTMGELRSIASVMEDYGILCSKFPKEVHLTMDYGPVYLHS